MFVAGFPPIPLNGVFYSAGDPTSGPRAICLARDCSKKQRERIEFMAIRVHEPEIVLRAGVPLRGGQPILAHGFGGVLWGALASVVLEPEIKLRLGLPLRGSDTEIGHGLVTCLRRSR